MMEDSIMGRLDKIIELLELILKIDNKKECAFKCNCLERKQLHIQAQSGRVVWCPVHGNQYY